MAVIHAHKDYWEIKKELTKRNDEFFAQWVEFSSVLVKHWYSHFTVVEFQVLTFIAGRTLLFRKKAEAITRAQFYEGVRSGAGDPICSGCGVGETTLRRALKSLEDRGYIHVHAFSDGVSEQVSRIYEILPQRLLMSFDISEVTNMLNRAGIGRLRGGVDGFDDENSLENSEFSPRQTPLTKRGTPPHEVRVITDILHISKTSTNVDVSAPSTPTNSGPILRTSRSRRKGQIAIDCNKPKVDLPTSAKDKLAALHNKQKALATERTTRAGRMPTIRWSTKDLQAVLDAARAQCGLSLPRIIVTAKPISTLHRRMLAAGVEDCLDFFTWALRNWNRVANANRKAKSRKMKTERVSDSEMALSPNFQDLAYRFPYILAFYNDRKYMEMVEEESKQLATATQTELVAAQQKAIAANKRKVAERDKLREEQRKAEDEKYHERRRAKPRTAPGLEDDEIPQFRERSWRQ